MIITVDHFDDPRLSAYQGLTDMDARLRREGSEGFYMAEGSTVIARALAEGHAIVSTLSLAKWCPELKSLGIDDSVPMYVSDENVLHAVTGFHVHRGALAVFRRPALLSVHELVADARIVLVLEDLVDHANVGAAFRSSAGLGVDAVVLSPRCADPLYRRAVKTSMGATIRLPWARATLWPDALTALVSAGFDVWGLTPGIDAEPLDQAVETGGSRIAIVVGTEGAGLTEVALRSCSRHVRIPMHNDVDSLNVAAASAVAMYAVASTGRRGRQ